MAVITIHRDNNDGQIYIRIVDRENRKVTEAKMSVTEYGYMITGLVGNKNCEVNYRELSKENNKENK